MRILFLVLFLFLDHQHAETNVAPLALAEIETIAVQGNPEIRVMKEQIALARQAVAAARIKYTVGRVPQQDVLKAQVALTKLADHLAMFLQDGDLARVRLNTLMGRDPASPLEVTGEYLAAATLPAAG